MGRHFPRLARRALHGARAHHARPPSRLQEDHRDVAVGGVNSHAPDAPSPSFPIGTCTARPCVSTVAISRRTYRLRLAVLPLGNPRRIPPSIYRLSRISVGNFARVSCVSKGHCVRSLCGLYLLNEHFYLDEK